MLDIQKIKEKVNILDLVAPYCNGLVKSGNSYRAKINPLRQENTSSLYFYEDTQRFHDFGTGISGDAFDFYSRVTGTPLKEAFTTLNDNQVAQNVINKTKAIQKEKFNFTFIFAHLEPLSLQIHKTALLELFPAWLIREAEPANLSLLGECLHYDKEYQTFAYAIKNQQKQIVGIKRRYFRIDGQLKKWVALKGSEANHCFSNIKSGSEPIFILEGIKDGLYALLLGLNFIALPSASYKNFNQDELESLAGREVILIADIDSVGIQCMQRLAAQIANIATCYFILDLRLFLIAATFNDGLCFKPHEKLDFADGVRLHTQIGNKPFCNSFSECFKAQLLLYVNMIQSGEKLNEEKY